MYLFLFIILELTLLLLLISVLSDDIFTVSASDEPAYFNHYDRSQLEPWFGQQPVSQGGSSGVRLGSREQHQLMGTGIIEDSHQGGVPYVPCLLIFRVHIST